MALNLAMGQTNAYDHVRWNFGGAVLFGNETQMHRASKTGASAR